MSRSRGVKFGLVVSLSGLLTGCPPGQKVAVPAWNQFHGDPASTGQVLVGTKPAKDTGVVSGPIGTVAYSSPVLAPDGSVYVATFVQAPNPQGVLLRLSTAPTVTVRNSGNTFNGQLTTPAVDGSGNVYAARYNKPAGGSADSSLQSYGPALQLQWSLPLVGGRALAPPRVLEVTGGRLIFQAYSGGASAGGHVLVASEQGTKLRDVDACNRVEGGSGAGFQVPGVDLGFPYAEDPAVGIRALQGDGGWQHYLVIATPACGVTFFRLDLAATATDAPTLTTIKEQDSDALSFSTPAISADGIVVIADSNKRVTAYELTTGKEKWHYDASAFVASTPTLLPLAINFAYVASYDRMIKLDLATGLVAAEKGLVGPTDASPAAGGQNIFVSTKSGVFTYDLDLNLLAFSPLAGGDSSPAIGPSGAVYVAGTNGSFSVFGGP